MTHKVKALMELDVPKVGSRTEFVKIYPRIITAKWSKNNHLEADELTVTFDRNEAGVDPRTIKNCRGAFWMYDSNREELDFKKHLRFTGIAHAIERKLDDSGWVVEISFLDYTTLFINNKPMKTSGMPDYSDTLQQIWERICDNTGWQDPDNDKILSSVEALKPHLIFAREDMKGRTLGETVPERFHKIAKPTPKHGASSWDTWQWCIGSLALISYIDKDECVITDTTEHYTKTNAPQAIYGHNIHSLEEKADTGITSKGILLKSMDPLTGRVLEAFYPAPGDQRIKTRRAAVSKHSDEGATITANEVSGEYEEYNRYDVTDQTALDRCAVQAYEERNRQQMTGSFKTSEMFLFTPDNDAVDILGLRAGEPISIEIEPGLRDTLLGLAGGEGAQIRYLVDRSGYDQDLASLIVANLGAEEFASPIFHTRSLEIDYGPENFEVEVKFHSIISVET